jgi:hypothetical protein
VTPSLLEHLLIQKYFKPDFKAYYPVMDKTHQMDAEAWDRCAMAYRILQAMEEPIKIGDKLLRIIHVERIEEYTAKIDAENGFEHGSIVCLRLPPQFQPEREKKCEPFMVKCESCGYEASIHMPKQGDTAKFNIPKPPLEAGCEPMNSRRDRPCKRCGGCHCPELPGVHSHVEVKPDPAKDDAVEWDIEDILVAISEGIYTKAYFQKRLEELVDLARRAPR